MLLEKPDDGEDEAASLHFSLGHFQLGSCRYRILIEVYIPHRSLMEALNSPPVAFFQGSVRIGTGAPPGTRTGTSATSTPSPTPRTRTGTSNIPPPPRGKRLGKGSRPEPASSLHPYARRSESPNPNLRNNFLSPLSLLEQPLSIPSRGTLQRTLLPKSPRPSK